MLPKLPLESGEKLDGNVVKLDRTLKVEATPAGLAPEMPLTSPFALPSSSWLSGRRGSCSPRRERKLTALPPSSPPDSESSSEAFGFGLLQLPPAVLDSALLNELDTFSRADCANSEHALARLPASSFDRSMLATLSLAVIRTRLTPLVSPFAMVDNPSEPTLCRLAALAAANSLARSCVFEMVSIAESAASDAMKRKDSISPAAGGRRRSERDERSAGGDRGEELSRGSDERGVRPRRA
mmetsp:Transcript_15816/g.48001  ORF Transcript_15816/g.48001 Transcript_15816/m.48001 type:complete len:240 (-) Transcript_15816:76-795(-)